MKYSPHDYQAYATDFILQNPVAAVFLDMGLGKSVITLTAIKDLCLDSFQVRKVLVIAPLRVARDTWPSEIEKWDHLKDLKYAVAVGTEMERKTALMQKANVYIINRENVQWLVEESGLPFDYDMVVIDELSSFKSFQAKRFRSLLKVRPTVKRMVGLTGTPSQTALWIYGRNSGSWIWESAWADLLPITETSILPRISEMARWCFPTSRSPAQRRPYIALFPISRFP